MNGKQIVTALAVAGLISLAVLEANHADQPSRFEAWKKEFGVKYESEF